LLQDFDYNKEKDVKMIKDRIRKHMYVDQIQLKGIMERLEMEKDLDVITDMQSFSDFM
jgi:hypothetical protein